MLAHSLKVAAPALLLAAVAFATGCAAVPQAEEEKEAQDSAFSIFPTDQSLLPTIEAKGGKLDVCVALVDAAPEMRKSWRARATANFDSTVKQWNDLLQGHPNWNVEAVTPTYTFVDGKPCSAKSATVKINIWTTVEGFKADNCSNGGTCASAARPELRTFFLGPWNRDQEVDALDPFTTLHEYGHLLGLGDTYKVPGANEWIGEQPPSVMNGVSQTLTDDDKLGIWVMLRAVKTGVRSCDGFGRAVDLTANVWSVVMCDSSSKPVDTHGTTVINTGEIPQSDLEMASEATVTASQLNCRAGAGVEFPVLGKLVRGDNVAVATDERILHSTEGSAWLHVTLQDGETACYVSAKYEYIQPLE